MTFLLDSNILVFFFNCRRQGELAGASATVQLAITDAVEKELADHKTRGRGLVLNPD